MALHPHAHFKLGTAPSLQDAFHRWPQQHLNIIFSAQGTAHLLSRKFQVLLAAAKPSAALQCWPLHSHVVLHFHYHSTLKHWLAQDLNVRSQARAWSRASVAVHLAGSVQSAWFLLPKGAVAVQVPMHPDLSERDAGYGQQMVRSL